jgi:hypothetical protein
MPGAGQCEASVQNAEVCFIVRARSRARDDPSSAGHRLPASVRVDMLDFDEDRLGRVEGRRRAAGRVADPQVQACYGQMSRRVPKSDAVKSGRETRIIAKISVKKSRFGVAPLPFWNNRR